MSDEQATPEERRQNIKALISQASSALYDIDSWLDEGDLDQAQAALEDAGSTLHDIEEWLEEASEKGGPA